MSTFGFRAVDLAGVPARGEMEASSKSVVSDQLRQRGLIVLEESFHYAPDGNRYNLILEDVHAVEVGNKPPAKVSGKADPNQKLPKLGPG